MICDAVILAAGASTRLGRPKQLLRYGKTTLLERVVTTVSQTPVRRTVVVLGADAATVRSAIGTSFDWIVNANWEDGIASSIRAGLGALDGPDAVLLAACDQPRIPADHYRTLVQTAASHPARSVASGYEAVIGVPAVFPGHLFAELVTLTGDTGARSLLGKSVAIVVPCPEAAWDVDTPEEAADLVSTDPRLLQS